MANSNIHINRFVLQELGDITEGVRLVDNLIEHIDINESKLIYVSMGGTFIQSYSWWLLL